MLIAILGGTGGIGGHVLSWALDAGHPVRALARRPEALPRRDSLTVVRGDALDAAAVAETIAAAGAARSRSRCWPGRQRTSSRAWTRPEHAGWSASRPLAPTSPATRIPAA